MNTTLLTPIVQRTLLALNAGQLGYLAIGYFNGALSNQFPVLDTLFRPAVATTCTETACWQSIVPFLGSMYISVAFISILALFFRSHREIRLIITGLASVHIAMAVIRLTVAPAHLYASGAAQQASTVQFVFGVLMLCSALLPSRRKPDQGD